MIYSTEDKWSFHWDKQLPTESINYIWHPTRHAIECFHTYFNNNRSHKDHISGYNYIIKCYLKLLVTFCHTLLHTCTCTCHCSNLLFHFRQVLIDSLFISYMYVVELINLVRIWLLVKSKINFDSNMLVLKCFQILFRFCSCHWAIPWWHVSKMTVYLYGIQKHSSVNSSFLFPLKTQNSPITKH